MILHEYIGDAERVAEQLPQDSAIRYLASHLLHRIAPKGIEGDPELFTRNYPHTADPRDGSFYVTDQSTLQRKDIESGIQNILDGPGTAFVAHGSKVRSVLALPKYDGTLPITNANILLHELEHLTERESGLLSPDLAGRDYVANLGERESRTT